MKFDKVKKQNNYELLGFILVYIILISNVIITGDSWIAFVSAFCGISYTILAGKGVPICYLIGVVGSVFYSYLSFKNALWGNLVLYACYYVPLQIIGFFLWNKNLQKGKNEIIKTSLSIKERYIYFCFATLFSIPIAYLFMYFNDTHPIIDSITTVFSVLGMILTVKRTLEQWIVWIIVNGLSFIMWLLIVIGGAKVYSTVIMWAVYFVLAIYFYINWKKDLKNT